MAQVDDDIPPPAAAAEEDIDLDDAELLAEAAEDLETPEEEETPVVIAPEDADRLGDLDALGQYLREIGRYPLLNAGEGVMLAKRIEAGAKSHKRLATNEKLTAAKRRELEALRRDGEAAKHDMVQANLRLVVSIARRYR